MHSTECLPANTSQTIPCSVLNISFEKHKDHFTNLGVGKRIINVNRGWRKLESRNGSVKRSKKKKKKDKSAVLFFFCRKVEL